MQPCSRRRLHHAGTGPSSAFAEDHEVGHAGGNMEGVQVMFCCQKPWTPCWHQSVSSPCLQAPLCLNGHGAEDVQRQQTQRWSGDGICLPSLSGITQK